MGQMVFFPVGFYGRQPLSKDVFEYIAIIFFIDITDLVILGTTCRLFYRDASPLFYHYKIGTIRVFCIRLHCSKFLQILMLVVAFLFLAASTLRVSAQSPQVSALLPDVFLSVEDHAIEVPPDKPIALTIYGEDLQNVTFVAFATTHRTKDSSCEMDRATPASPVFNKTTFAIRTLVTLRQMSPSESAFYLCFKVSPPLKVGNETLEWIHALSSPVAGHLLLLTATQLMPIWLQIILIIVLFFLSGLFSGLNLGLMSLDKTELKIIETAGDPDEKRYAKTIRPVREKGNLLLCTVLLGNVLVNTSLTILMDNLTGSGVFAVIASTLGITLFGEIIPQAICSRHGLAIGAKTIWLTKLFMVLTFPLAFPISFILDKLLGDEIGAVYNREKLGVLLKEQQDAGLVAPDEMNIIAGALNMSTKTVGDIMSPIADAFMLPHTAILDFDTMNEIFSHGFTRIPIYEGDRRNIKAILNVKDLGFINADDKVPVATVCNFYNRSILVVPDTTSLETMLNEFRQGKAHMAFVERLVTDGQGDPYREMIGLVTLEDVIEEIIQAEIVDETDVFTDNTFRQARPVRKNDFRMFNTSNSNKPRHHLSPQLKIAALRHLASNVETFSDEYVTLPVLQSLLNSNVVTDHVFNSRDENENIIYRANQWANYAILILQGRALVETSAEHLVFEAGPFMLFGETVLKYVNDIYPEVSTLKDPELQSAQLAAKARFLPDYTVRAITNIQFLRITAEHYLLARRLSAWITKLHPQGTNGTTDGSSVLQLSGPPDPDALPLAREPTLAAQPPGTVPAFLRNEANSQDFFQAAWDRHVSHLREATRASILASLVYPPSTGDGASASTAAAAAPTRRSSSRASVVTSPVRQSCIDGVSFDSNSESIVTPPKNTSGTAKDLDCADSLSQGVMTLAMDEQAQKRQTRVGIVSNPRSFSRFSLPSKYILFGRRRSEMGLSDSAFPQELKQLNENSTKESMCSVVNGTDSPAAAQPLKESVESLQESPK